jgi:hypothetical protein
MYARSSALHAQDRSPPQMVSCFSPLLGAVGEAPAAACCHACGLLDAYCGAGCWVLCCALGHCVSIGCCRGLALTLSIVLVGGASWKGYSLSWAHCCLDLFGDLCGSC